MHLIPWGGKDAHKVPSFITVEANAYTVEKKTCNPIFTTRFVSTYAWDRQIMGMCSY